MDLYAMTDKGILTEIANRIKSLRLRRNITQEQLSKATALSLTAIKSLETGGGKLTTLVAVLRELSALDAIDNFIPEVTVSPLQLAKTRGKRRQRASGGQHMKAGPIKDHDKW